MRLENIRLDVEGLKKLIDFLHSDANINKITGVERPSDNMVFALEKAGYIEEGEVPKHYLVTIHRRFGYNSPDEYFNKLVDLLKDCSE